MRLLKNLEILNMSENAITAIPDSLFELSKLKTLRLRKNCLTVLPEGVNGLISIEKLDLRGNLWASIPANIIQLTSREKVPLIEFGFIGDLSLPPSWGADERREFDRLMGQPPNVIAR